MCAFAWGVGSRSRRVRCVSTYNFPEVARSPDSQTTQPKPTGSAVRYEAATSLTSHCLYGSETDGKPWPEEAGD